MRAKLEEARWNARQLQQRNDELQDEQLSMAKGHEAAHVQAAEQTAAVQAELAATRDALAAAKAEHATMQEALAKSTDECEQRDQAIEKLKVCIL